MSVSGWAEQSRARVSSTAVIVKSVTTLPSLATIAVNTARLPFVTTLGRSRIVAASTGSTRSQRSWVLRRVGSIVDSTLMTTR